MNPLFTVIFRKRQGNCYELQRSGYFRQGLYLILLSPQGAADLLGMQVNPRSIEAGPRGLLAAGVADVDAAYEELKAKGVTFVRPPTDQRWGLRTAHFADPEGNLWEINQSIGPSPEGSAKPF